MTIDKFPAVSAELITALREFFPINERTLAEPQAEIQQTLGKYQLINFLEYVHDVQTNPESE
jgi:hypothetical protein|tara:strand:- start:887 stop:1072 length:186 start_codon:yes stop_codon:yes gene_type:complete